MTDFTPPPAAPSRSDTPATFISRADAFLAWFATLYTELTAFVASLSLVSTTDTSSSSVAIGTGAKSFTVSAGKSFSPGMYLVIADTALPSTNSMFGQVTSYNTGTGALVMNIESIKGSGTKAAWTISQSAAGGAGFGGNTFTGIQKFAVGANIASAATLNFATATGNTVHVTGTTPVSSITMNVGQWIEAVYDAACPLTYHATNHNLNTGGASYTLAAGDSVFYFHDGTKILGCISPLSGKSVIGRVATTSAAGEAELCTSAETAARVDTSKVVTAESLQGLLVAAAAVGLTNQTVVDFTGIPSWAKRITVILLGISGNGTSIKQIQLGDSGGFEVTGYIGTTTSLSTVVNTVQHSAGFLMNTVESAVAIYSGIVTLECITPGNPSWVCSFSTGRGDSAATQMGGGQKTLSGVLDRVRVTTVNGTDQFDGGFLGLHYE